MKSRPDPGLSSCAAFLAAKDEGLMQFDSVDRIQDLHFAQGDKAAARVQIEVNA
jgi:hypothetical protein